MEQSTEFISTLPIDAVAIPLTFVASQLAAAFHDPSDEESDGALRHGLLRIQFESEIAEAVQLGKLPVRHPETWGILSFPTPSALVRVDELNEYLRASGRPIRVVSPSMPRNAPDWGLWGSMSRWELWQAIALTCNFDPLKIQFLKHAWMGHTSDYPHIDFRESGFSAEQESTYKKRYMLLRDAYRRPPFSCKTALTAEHMNQVEAEAFLEWTNIQPLFGAMPFEMQRQPKRAAHIDISPVTSGSAKAAAQTLGKEVLTETPAERRAKLLAMFEAEEQREKRGALQRLADREGSDRSNLGKLIAKAKVERDEKAREGGWTSQLVQNGKRAR